MMELIYTFILFPIVQLIELCYLFAFRILKNPALSLIGVSIVVSILTLPLYLIAEKHQQKERDIQKKLKPGIDKIKAIFKGDERYMMLSTYYKQNHYHPVYAMRNVFSLIIQIPFFIAAYSYLSSINALQGASFLIIKDLSLPDGVLKLHNININILPLLMTLINIISGSLYSKGMEIKNKIQVYGIAIIFLILLYNSPSGIVLYWTFNNIFSLIKNLIQRSNNSKLIIYITLCIFAFFINIFIVFFHPGYWIKRLIVFVLSSSIFFLPLFIKIMCLLKQRIYPSLILKVSEFWQNQIFFFSSLNLFLLVGLIIPLSLVASSVFEFSFIEPYTSPMPFIINTAMQALGIFIVWPFCIYFFFSKNVKIGLTIILLALGITALINTFLAFENFGFLTNTLIFSNPKPFFSHFKTVIVNLIAVFATICILFIILLSKYKKILVPFNIVIFISLTVFGVYNFIKINKEYSQLYKARQHGYQDLQYITPVYTFSQTGKNVLFIMLDRGIGGYVPEIFEEKQELLSIFSGFTWYSNSASFSNHTMIGAPPLYGGYEYTPFEINKRTTVTMSEKHKEAYSLLPVLFSNAGYSVTITDIPNYNLFELPTMDIFNNYPEIIVENVKRKYTHLWLQRHPDIKELNISNILKSNLLRFSFFKISPVAFRSFIYDNGKWLVTLKTNAEKNIYGGLTIGTIEEYVYFDLLPDLTDIREEMTNNLFMLYSQLPSSQSYFQAPEYIPATEVTDRGSGPFGNELFYHANIATFITLGKWFSFLKENNVYDNTKIILVADHGEGNTLINHPQNITLPNGEQVSRYNPLLMVKDFNQEGDLIIDNSFMTNADAPLLTLENIIDNLVNPFTKNSLQSDKTNGINITTLDLLDSQKHLKYQYNIGKNQWLHVKDNIFDPDNWRAAE